MHITELERHLKSNIIGQGRALELIAETIKRVQVLGLDKDRPQSSQLFFGPSGVGKTETAKLLSIFFCGRDELIRFDMGNYQTLDGVNDLRKGICKALNEFDDGILFFDEMEKAHLDVHNIFLQLLGDALVTDLEGKTYSVKNYHVIFTSNIGADRLLYATDRTKLSTIEDAVLEEARSVLKPEFLGRFDNLICFNRLTRDVMREVAEVMLKNHLKLYEGHEIEYQPEIIEMIVRESLNGGKDRIFGARPFRKYIERHVGNAVTNEMLKSECDNTSGLLAIVKNDIKLLTNKVNISKSISKTIEKRLKAQIKVDGSIVEYFSSVQIDDIAEFIKHVREKILEKIKQKKGRLYFCQKSGELQIDEDYKFENNEGSLRFIDISPFRKNRGLG